MHRVCKRATADRAARDCPEDSASLAGSSDEHKIAVGGTEFGGRGSAAEGEDLCARDVGSNGSVGRI